MNTSMGNISLGEIQTSPKQTRKFDFSSSGREASNLKKEAIRHSEEALQASYA